MTYKLGLLPALTALTWLAACQANPADETTEDPEVIETDTDGGEDEEPAVDVGEPLSPQESACWDVFVTDVEVELCVEAAADVGDQGLELISACGEIESDWLRLECLQRGASSGPHGPAIVSACLSLHPDLLRPCLGACSDKDEDPSDALRQCAWKARNEQNSCIYDAC